MNIKNKNIVSIAICLFYLGIVQVSAQAGWRVLSSSNETLISGKPYYLQVAKNEFFLRYKKRGYGINLKWGKTSSPNISFKKSGPNKSILCGDKVAIHVKGGGYLVYKKRRWGINLVWSKTPVYQWEVRTIDNAKGTAVKTNTMIGLLNHVENKNKGDFMVYCKRKNMPVVNLAWFGDCKGGARLPGKLNDYSTYINFAIKHKRKLLLLL